MTHVVTKYETDVDLSRAGKTACPRCRSEGKDKSGNNFHVYGLDENGEHRGGRCFSCNYRILSEEWLRENSIEEELEEVLGKEFNREVFEKIKARTGTDSKNYRAIPRKVSEFFNVRYGYDEQDGGVSETYYPVTQEGKMKGYKVRTHPKDFAYPGPFGETGKDCDMFGQVRFTTFSNTVIIVGGEHDQLAAYTMLAQAQKNGQYDPPAVVSPTVGESGAFRQIQAQYEFFNQFKKIIICMDNDATGLKAIEDIVEVLPRGKAYVMKMRYKDPNKYLEDGKANEFVSDFWNAKPYTPEGVKSAADGMAEIAEELNRPRIPLPEYMYKMEDMMGGGIIQGRIINIIAFTSVGKSAHVNRMVYHWVFNSPVKPAIISLEATAGQYSLDMLSIHLKDNLMWNRGEEALIEWLVTPEGKQAAYEVSTDENGQPRYYLVDDREGGVEEVEAQVEKLWKKHGVKLFVIDVLSDLLRGEMAEKAENHLSWQRKMVKNGVTIVNVLHTRKPQNGGGSNGDDYKKVTEYDALGTGSFVQSAAVNIVLNRDKLNENSFIKNTTEASLAKCRGGMTGDAGYWYYDFATATCYDRDDYLMAHPELKLTKEKK